MPCCVKGYHVYKDICAAVIGEELVCDRELNNARDRYTVSVMKNGIIIGHICSLFLRRGGCICCRVTEARRYSADQGVGGLKYHVACC